MVVVNTVICYDSAGQVTATRPVATFRHILVSLVVVVNFLIAIILVAKWRPRDVASGQIPAYLSVTGGEYCNLLSFWWPSDGLVASGHIPAYLSVTGVEYCDLQFFWWPSDGHVTSGHVPDIPAIVSVVVNNLHCMPVVVRYIISPCNLLPGWLLFCWLDHSHSEALGPG